MDFEKEINKRVKEFSSMEEKRAFLDGAEFYSEYGITEIKELLKVKNE